MSEQPIPQLLMQRDNLDDLPELVLPDGFSIHTYEEDSPKVWEWIIRDSFKDPNFTYKAFSDDPSVAPDRVYFVKAYTVDIATTTAQYLLNDPDCGTVHMVGTHSWYTGQGAGYLAVLAVLHRMKQDGKKYAQLTTDDFRLPAIRIYEKLGFHPVMNYGGAQARWDAVHAKLAARKEPQRELIPLWEGEAPYTNYSLGQPQPTLKPFAIEGSKGAVVVCPGGAYVMKASHEADPVARMLNAAGISAYVLDYRVAPCHREAPLADAQRAIRLLKAMGYEKVGILGFSAGGHLCCSAATLYTPGNPESPDPAERFSSRPDAFVPCYPVVNFKEYTHLGSVQNLLGEEAQNPELLEHYSCEKQVTEDTPPAFLWHTSTDEAVPVENSLFLAAALHRANVPFELHVFPVGQHGLGLAGGIPGIEEWPRLCQKWLLTQGF